MDGLGLEATSTTGIVRGIAVDDAIRPLGNVTITLSGPETRDTVTNQEGAFGFEGLPAGTYFLEASKPGFGAVQQSVEVVAGVAEPPIVKLLLPMDEATRPFFEAYVFEGYIECSGSFVVVGVALCGAPNVFTDFTCDEAGICPGNVTQDAFSTRYTLSRKPTWLQSEMVWDSTQALGSEMLLAYSWNCPEETLLCDHEVSGVSPLVLAANATALDDINEGNLGQDGETLFVRVFNDDVDGTRPPTPICSPLPDPADACVRGGLGATLQQRFTIYTHAFYGYQPPPEWRFSAGGDLPRPPE